MKRILLLVVLLNFGLSAIAQQTSSLKGIIMDSDSGQPLGGAVVLVDSTRHAVADQKGTFTVTRIPRGEKQVEISFLGYEAITRTVNLDKGTVDLGTIRMKEERQQIDAVEVTAEIPMVVQKGDTLQFNAGAFKTNPDADAGDLINKMPATEVGDDGSVTVQGEAVKKVYVDGKQFFGDDVAAAMRNLPADIVESVQMFEEMTDEAKFSGFDDGNRQRAMNIVTKHKFNRTTTARVQAGYGQELQKDPDGKVQDRYLMTGSFNTFTEKHRWSVDANFNNVNRANRSRGFDGGGGGGMRGGGLRTINSAGINYSGTWTEQLNFNANYSFNENRSNSESWSERDYFQADDDIEHRFERTDRTGHSQDFAHEAGIRLEYKGAKDQVFFNTNGLFKNGDSWTNTMNQTWLDNILNSAIAENSNSSSDSYNVNGHLVWRHRLGEKAGRAFSLSMNGTFSENNSETDRERDRDAETVDFIHTFTTTDQWNRSIGGSVGYTEPLSDNSVVRLSYRINQTKSKSTKEAWDEVNQQLDTALSSTFSRNVLRNQVGLGYNYNYEAFRFAVGIDYQNSEQKRMETFPDMNDFKYNFDSWEPYARAHYRVDRSKMFMASYRGNSGLPSIEQLQDVLTESGTNLSRGNPNLKQSYTHDFMLRYNTSNVERNTTFFASINASQTDNQVSSRVDYFDADTVLVDYNNYLAIAGMQMTTPVNLNGAVSLRSNFGYSFYFRPIKTTIDMNGGYTYGRSPSYTTVIVAGGGRESVLNHANRHGGHVQLKFASNISENVDFDISTRTSLTYAANSALENSRIWGESVRARMSFIFPYNITYNTDFAWNYSNSKTDQRNLTTNTYVWNMGVGYKFLKRRQAEFRVTLHDVLNQSQKAPRISFGDTYQTTSWSRSLGRYVMGTLSFRFNSLNRFSNSSNREGGRERGEGMQRGQMMGPPSGGMRGGFGPGAFH